MSPSAPTARRHRVLVALAAAWVVISMAIGGASTEQPSAPDAGATRIASSGATHR